MAPNAKPIIILKTIQEKSEVNNERATIRHPERNIPAKSVGLTPYNSIVLPTRGALNAIPINIAVAQNPINGVGTSLASRITDVTGIIIPQQNPTVNTALITVRSGVDLRFINGVSWGKIQRKHYLCWQITKKFFQPLLEKSTESF
jgi:hypothetical protein